MHMCVCKTIHERSKHCNIIIFLTGFVIKVSELKWTSLTLHITVVYCSDVFFIASAK